MTTEWYKFWNSSEKNTAALDNLFRPNNMKDAMRSISYQLNLHKNNTIAEFGCGHGNMLCEFENHSKKTYGVDFSERANSNKFNSTTILINDSFNIEAKDGLFDRSYCFSLFNFLTLEETIATMKEMIRCTKKDGYILFADIIDKKFEKVFEMKTKDVNCPHLSSYNRSDLYRVLESIASRDSMIYDIYDTNYNEYKNNEMTFNILIWKK